MVQDYQVRAYAGTFTTEARGEKRENRVSSQRDVPEPKEGIRRYAASVTPALEYASSALFCVGRLRRANRQPL